MPITEVYLLFYQSAIPTCKDLQRENPLIYLIHFQMWAFLKNLLTKLLKAQVIVDAGSVDW